MDHLPRCYPHTDPTLFQRQDDPTSVLAGAGDAASFGMVREVWDDMNIGMMYCITIYIYIYI